MTLLFLVRYTFLSFSSFCPRSVFLPFSLPSFTHGVKPPWSQLTRKAEFSPHFAYLPGFSASQHVLVGICPQPAELQASYRRTLSPRTFLLWPFFFLPFFLLFFHHIFIGFPICHLHTSFSPPSPAAAAAPSPFLLSPYSMTLFLLRGAILSILNLTEKFSWVGSLNVFSNECWFLN